MGLKDRLAEMVGAKTDPLIQRESERFRYTNTRTNDADVMPHGAWWTKVMETHPDGSKTKEITFVKNVEGKVIEDFKYTIRTRD